MQPNEEIFSACQLLQVRRIDDVLFFALSLSKGAWQQHNPVRASTSSARTGLCLMQLIEIKNAATARRAANAEVF